MPPRSPLDFDVSVSADKRRRQRVRGMSGSFDASGRCCEWGGCTAKAEYRAPHSPEKIDEYRWFCLDHVRQYNQSWNYFADCTADELEAHFRNDRVWGRPTWSLGGGPKGAQGMQPHAEGRAWARFGFSDPLDVLGDNATKNPARAPGDARPRRRLAREEQLALDTLGLPHQVESRAEIRARYRELVKELHPDMNGGSNPEPERLARILKAWQLLRKSPSFAK